jgi:hypothetical protein
MILGKTQAQKGRFHWRTQGVKGCQGKTDFVDTMISRFYVIHAST